GAPTARSSASTRRWRASGPTASATAPIDTAPPPCHTGSTTTTHADRTARSAAYPRSAAFTTSVGRTPRAWSRCHGLLLGRAAVARAALTAGLESASLGGVRGRAVQPGLATVRHVLLRTS